MVTVNSPDNPSLELLPCSKSLLFSVPSLAKSNLSLNSLHVDDTSDEQPPWYGWVGEDSVDLVLEGLGALFRGLEFAGFQVDFVEIGIAAGAGSAPDGWIRISIPTLAIVFSTLSIISEEGIIPDPWIPADRFGVRLRLARRLTTAQRELALLIISPYAVENYLCFSSQKFSTSPAELSAALEDSGIYTCVLELLTALEARWQAAQQGDMLDPFTFTQPPGLLWMFDPTYWDYDLPTWDTPEAASVRNLAANITDLISQDPLAFFMLQTGFEEPVLVRSARLRKLFEQAPGLKPSMAPLYTLSFFQTLQARNEELGLPLSVNSFSNIAGFSYEQFNSPLRYCDMLMHLAQARLFPFPALPDSNQPSPYDYDVDPVDVHSLQDELTGLTTGVQISIFDEPPLLITQEVYFGYPFEILLLLGIPRAGCHRQEPPGHRRGPRHPDRGARKCPIDLPADDLPCPGFPPRARLGGADQ